MRADAHDRIILVMSIKYLQFCNRFCSISAIEVFDKDIDILNKL